MYGTLNFRQADSHPEFIDRTASFLEGSTTQQPACDQCRAKKIKCVRGQQSCIKCESAGIACSYSDNLSHRQQRSQQTAGASEPSPRLLRQESDLDQPIEAGIEDGLLNLRRHASWNNVGSISDHPRLGLARPEAKSHSPVGLQSQPWRRKGLSIPGRQSFHYHPYNGVKSTSPTFTNSIEIRHQTELGKRTACDSTGEGAPSESSHSIRRTSHATEASHDSISVQEFSHNELDLDRLFNNDYIDDEGSLAGLEPWPLSSSDPCGGQNSAAADSQRRRSEIPKMCTCLSMVVALLDDLDLASHSATNILDLDATLQSNKVGLLQARQILDCTKCSARSEHIALLTRACDALAQLAENAATVVLRGDKSHNWSAPPSSTVSPSQPMRHLQKNSVEFSQPLPCSEDGASSVVRCGRYEADKSEWECVLRLLTVIQLRALHQLLDDLKTHTTQLHFSRLDSIRFRTKGLLDRLQRPTG